MNLLTRSKLKHVSISAVVTRANGKVENLGIVAERYGSFWLRWRARLKMLAFAAVIVIAFLFAHPGAILAAGPFFMDAGKAIVTNLVSGIGGTVPKFVAMGTGAGPSASTGTALSTEVETRTSGTVSRVTTTVANDTYQVVGTVTATATRVVTECGLFDASTVGNMLIGSGISTITLANGDSITFTFKLQFS